MLLSLHRCPSMFLYFLFFLLLLALSKSSLSFFPLWFLFGFLNNRNLAAILLLLQATLLLMIHPNRLKILPFGTYLSISCLLDYSLVYPGFVRTIVVLT